jgi:hypothetical protein
MLKHNKWFRNLGEGNILIKEQLYELARTENKREFVYDEKGLAISTKAFTLNYSRAVKTIK